MAMPFSDKKRKRNDNDQCKRRDDNEKTSLEEDKHEDEDTDNSEEEEISDDDEEECDDTSSEEEDYDEDEDEDGDSSCLMKQLSNLSLSPSDNNNDNGVIKLHIKFSRDFLWRRHLICESEIEKFGKEDMEFRVWRLETRLGQALIQANKKWTNILSHHVPLDCAPTALSLAEQLSKNELQWSDKVVEIMLCWLHCGDRGYCLMQTEKELLETCFAVEKMISMENNTYVDNKDNNNNIGHDEDVLIQRKYIMKLQECLEPLEEYIRELVEDGKEHLPMDRRFRVNQMCEGTLQKLDEGEYGYAFFGTSVVDYRHGVVWEGLHILNEGHVFAQDITLNIGRPEQEKYSCYLKYQDITDSSHLQLERANHRIFRLVFICNPESEIKAIYAFLQQARRITENAAKDSSVFHSPDTHVQQFLLNILNTDENIKKAAGNLNLEEIEGCSVYKGDLKDLLQVVGLAENNLQASLIVKNPTQEAFFTIYCFSEVMGYCLENNLLVVSSSVFQIQGLIRCILRKIVSFNWRKNYSPRSILELIKR